MTDDITIDQTIGAKARIIGIDYDNALIVLCGLFFGVMVFYGLSSSGNSLPVSLAPGAVITASISAWALLLKQGKPPAYDIDWFNSKILGKKTWEPDFKKIELNHFTK